MGQRVRSSVETPLVIELLELFQGLHVTRMRVERVGFARQLVIRQTHVVRHKLCVEFADIVRRGPGILVSERDGLIAGLFQRLAGGEEVAVGLGHVDPVIREDLLVVEHELRVDVDRHAVEPVLILERLKRRFGEGFLPVAAIDRVGDVERTAVAREVLAEFPGPGEEDVRHLVGPHQYADLVLVGFVRNGFHLDLDVGVGRFEFRDGGFEIGHVLGLRPFVQEAQSGVCHRRGGEAEAGSGGQ